MDKKRETLERGCEHESSLIHRYSENMEQVEISDDFAIEVDRKSHVGIIWRIEFHSKETTNQHSSEMNTHLMPRGHALAIVTSTCIALYSKPFICPFCTCIHFIQIGAKIAIHLLKNSVEVKEIFAFNSPRETETGTSGASGHLVGVQMQEENQRRQTCYYLLIKTKFKDKFDSAYWTITH